MFEKVTSREKFKSNRLKELAMDFSTDMSDRNASRRLNRIRHERVGISPQTYRNTVEREGAAIQAAMEKKCDETLLENGFDLNGELKEKEEFTPETSHYIPIEAIGTAACELNLKTGVYVRDYELPESSVQARKINVSCAKH